MSSRTKGKPGYGQRQNPTLELLEERTLLSVASATPNWKANQSIAIVSLSTSNRTQTGILMPLTKHYPSSSTTIRPPHSPVGHARALIGLQHAVNGYTGALPPRCAEIRSSSLALGLG